MEKEERDQCMEKFRKQEINVLVTTNLIARGIDIPDAQLVINYDVPTENVGTDKDRVMGGDADTYQHRIGRTGRFGSQGVALTLHDRESDLEMLKQITDHFKMSDKLKELKGSDELKQIMKKIQGGDEGI